MHFHRQILHKVRSATKAECLTFSWHSETPHLHFATQLRLWLWPNFAQIKPSRSASLMDRPVIVHISALSGSTCGFLRERSVYISACGQLASVNLMQTTSKLIGNISPQSERSAGPGEEHSMASVCGIQHVPGNRSTCCVPYARCGANMAIWPLVWRLPSLKALFGVGILRVFYIKSVVCKWSWLTVFVFILRKIVITIIPFLILGFWMAVTRLL